MRGGEESGLELRGRKVNSASRQSLKKRANLAGSLRFALGEIGHRTRREEEAEHRTDAMKNGRASFNIRSVSRVASSKLRARSFSQLAPAIDPLQFAELGQPGGHRERIAGKRSGLVNRTDAATVDP